MEGTYPLPEAQLDRFFFKLIVPSARIEAGHGTTIIGANDWRSADTRESRRRPR